MSIRARLLGVNLAIILISFTLVTLIAGSQIAAAVQADFEANLRATIQTIAQEVVPAVIAFSRDALDSAGLAAAFAPHEQQTGGLLRVFFTGREGVSGRNAAQNRVEFGQYSEVDAAMQRNSIVVQRPDDMGQNRLYTAASILNGGRPNGLIQLSVPSARLRVLLAERWAALALTLAALAVLTLLLTLMLVRSITTPLYRLRGAALRYAKGDLSLRLPETWRDEIGAVARVFNTMADQLQRVLDEQRAFASNTSHELRTPLTTIRLRAEALYHDDVPDPETARQYLQEINAEAERLSTLIQGLSLLSRFDSGRVDLGRDEIDIVRFAATLCQQLQPEAAAKQIALSLHAPEGPIHVQTNLAHLNVIFRNVLDNALKYTPPGGTVEWTVHADEDGLTHTVRDSGQGISAEHLPHVFERFYRTDRARSRDIPGTGLGLALVKSVVTAYGGTVSIHSDGADQGVTVRVCLPYRPPSPPFFGGMFRRF